MATREEILAAHPLPEFLEACGIVLHGQGPSKTTNRCPTREHKKDHQCVTVDTEKRVFRCCDCDHGGSVIDWVMLRDGLGVKEAMAKLSQTLPGSRFDSEPFQWPEARSEAEPAPKAASVQKAVYSYQNAKGDEVYQVVRYEPKTFRQRHQVNGKWVWGMDGVERVLYRLPELFRSERVAIVEGEKDADNLTSLGFCATCNVGGAGKWLDGYTESLAEKEVILIGDNDEPGRKHVDLVFDSIAGKVKSTRIVKIPPPHKDVSDFIAAHPDAKQRLQGMIEEATAFTRGLRIPILSMGELESKYRDFVNRNESLSVNLGKWMPSFNRLRPLIPGELALFIADTGVGKTAVLQSIALACRDIPTLFFEMEIPNEMLFERFMAARHKLDCREVEDAYRSGQSPGNAEALFPKLFISGESRLTPQRIEELIEKAELKMGAKPVLVAVDYVQLIQGKGSRYERVSSAAEELKVIAKTRSVVMLIASQISRSDKDSPEIRLHDAKDSGSLENSASLVVGLWRDPAKNDVMHFKVLKNTRGAGLHVEANYDGSKCLITECAKVSDEDVPKNRNRNPYPD